jgi:hypothetical protein
MAYVEANREDLEQWSPRNCDNCPGGDLCREPVTMADGDYPWCPWWRRGLSDWQGVVHTYNTIQVQPRTDWPDGLAAYISQGVMALDRALSKRMADKAAK